MQKDLSILTLASTLNTNYSSCNTFLDTFAALAPYFWPYTYFRIDSELQSSQMDQDNVAMCAAALAACFRVFLALLGLLGLFVSAASSPSNLPGNADCITE